MKYPHLEAARIIYDVMRKGSTKDGANESWRMKPASYHLKKAANHADLAARMYLKEIPADAEGWVIHAKNSLTRLIMAIMCAGE